jgi:hypothetical protein
MNKHAFMDRLTVGIARLATGKKKAFFYESLDSLTFEEMIRATELEVPGSLAQGNHEGTARTPAGELDPAYRVEQWLGHDHPTIIYHHGNNERPFDFGKFSKNSFRDIFVKSGQHFPANLVVVRAPFHNGSVSAYQKKMVRMENFIAMLSVSVRMSEAIVTRLKQDGAGKVIVCGTSLGGWVTNLHRSHYNTADLYVPLMAGTLLGELFIRSAYRKLAAGLVSRHPEKVRELLNFNTVFDAIGNKNVFPLLALHDQYIQYAVQKQSYEGHPLQTIPFGHVTGSLQAGRLKDHMLTCLDL